jgi:hypothetical protein
MERDSSGTPVYPYYYAETLGRTGPMTEPSSSARVGPGIAAGRSVSEQDRAADSPYAAVLDWGRTHNRDLNFDFRVGPVEPGAGRRWTGTLLQTQWVNQALGPPGGGRPPAWTRGGDSRAVPGVPGLAGNLVLNPNGRRSPQMGLQR